MDTTLLRFAVPLPRNIDGIDTTSNDPFAAADSKLPPKRKDPEMAALKGLFTTDQPRRRAIQRREALVATILNSMAVPLRRQTNVVDTG